jgi:ssDNA-binding replication factor A large subunit
MIYEVKENKDDATYKVIAKVEGVEKKKTKTGKDYVRATLRDETAKLQGAFVWPWKCKNSEGLKKGQFILATIQVDNGFTNLIRYSVMNGDQDDYEEGDEE